MKKKSLTKKKQPNHSPYAPETRLIWGKSFTPKWDYSHHVVPPLSSSSTFRLSSTKRGAKGFVEFAHHVGDFRVESKAPSISMIGSENPTRISSRRILLLLSRANVR